MCLKYSRLSRLRGSVAAHTQKTGPVTQRFVYPGKCSSLSQQSQLDKCPVSSFGRDIKRAAVVGTDRVLLSRPSRQNTRPSRPRDSGNGAARLGCHSLTGLSSRLSCDLRLTYGAQGAPLGCSRLPTCSRQLMKKKSRSKKGSAVDTYLLCRRPLFPDSRFQE